MKRGTSPIISLFISGIDLTQCQKVIFTFRQGGYKLVKTVENGDLEIVSKDTIYVHFTQEETLKLEAHKAAAELKVVTKEGVCMGSQTKWVPVEDTLLKEVI